MVFGYEGIEWAFLYLLVRRGQNCLRETSLDGPSGEFLLEVMKTCSKGSYNPVKYFSDPSIEGVDLIKKVWKEVEDNQGITINERLDKKTINK